MIEFFYRVDVFAEAEQHGHVSVVAAGVHLAGMGGHVVTCVGFRHRQSIHVGTQGEGICGSPVEPERRCRSRKGRSVHSPVVPEQKEDMLLSLEDRDRSPGSDEGGGGVFLIFQDISHDRS